jgi:glycosyltransferase involved in cell wall biosynthesis
LPSFSEGLSVSVLEAMGMGLPVIVTKACNMPEVEQHRTGWQIETTLDELVSALESLLSNCVCRNREIGARGAALVQANYTWNCVAAKMASVYQWLTGGPAPASVELVFGGTR